MFNPTRTDILVSENYFYCTHSAFSPPARTHSRGYLSTPDLWLHVTVDWPTEKNKGVSDINSDGVSQNPFKFTPSIIATIMITIYQWSLPSVCEKPSRRHHCAEAAICQRLPIQGQAPYQGRIACCWICAQSGAAFCRSRLL